MLEHKLFGCVVLIAALLIGFADVPARAQWRENRPQTQTFQTGNRYIAAISSKVRQHIVLPQNVDGNLVAEITMSVFRDGSIRSVWVSRSSGNVTYDAAVTN